MTQARSKLDIGQAQLVIGASPPVLYEHALAAGEGRLAVHGPLTVDTGKFTGRSANDKFIVRSASTEGTVDWGKINRPVSQEAFDRLKSDMEKHMRGRKLFVQDLFVGSDPRYQRKVRVITEYAWHSLFARNLLIRGEGQHDDPDWIVVDLPSFRADPARHESRSDTMIAMDMEAGLILIANTEYAGEIKKSVFTALNFELPTRGVMPMHCSANHSSSGEAALFFGLSGTGKTTLSSDQTRVLIGDDEHGWSEDGVFNFEGGCYAKVIDLKKDAEPEIFATTRRFGTVLENVAVDESTRSVDFSDRTRTENTRAAYPIDFIPNASDTGRGGHPRSVIFLTADAFGVLPPISRLDPAQAQYHFLSGYTAKLAGTERGVTEPQATFSACFGAPFMPRPAGEYARMLGELIERHGAKVWLVNTGWTGGPYGVGNRMKLAHTRAMVNAALDGKLDNVPTRRLPIFNLDVPVECPDVPSHVLDPRTTWQDKAQYDEYARRLAGMFRSNFTAFEGQVDQAILTAGPVD